MIDLLARGRISTALARIDDLLAEILIVHVAARNNDRFGTILAAAYSALERSMDARSGELAAVNEGGSRRKAKDLTVGTVRHKEDRTGLDRHSRAPRFAAGATSRLDRACPRGRGRSSGVSG